MKKRTFLFVFLCAAYVLNTFAYENFEGTPTVLAQWGGAVSVVENPLKSGVNTTDNVLRFNRINNNNWYAGVYVDGPDFTLEANSKKYVHIMVKCDDFNPTKGGNRLTVRAEGQLGTVNNYSLNTYTNLGDWQDMVFEIRRSGAEASLAVPRMLIMPDNTNKTNSTTYIYLDNIVINDDPTPRGTNFLSVANIYDFEDSTPSFLKDIRTFSNAANLVTYPVDNPFTTGINTSLKCGKRRYDTGTQFWSGFDFSFTNPVIVDDNNRYLHVMMAAPANNTEITIDARLLDNKFETGATAVGVAGNVALLDKAYTITTANTWQDIVIDLKAHMNTTLATPMPIVSAITIKCGKNGAMKVGDYYFDEIVINGDPNPRTQVASSSTINLSTISNSELTERVLSKGETLNINATKKLKKLTIRSGSGVGNTSGNTLTVGDLIIESDANGTGTYVEKESSSLTVSGTTTVRQHLTSGRNWYFASPVSNATSAVIKATEGNQLWERDVPGNTWTEITATNVDLTPLKGYVGKVTANGVITFSGTLNNTNIPALTLTKSNATNGQFHLVGNPYPSYLDWQTVAVANPNLTGSMWFRTKTAVTEQTPTSVYTFSTVLYNPETGLQIVNGNANTSVTRKIPPMQAFWVRIKDGVESVDFTINNNMREHFDVAGNKFKAPAVSNQTIRLEVCNGVNKDETLLYFNNHASDAFDRYDAPKMFNNNIAIPEIYTKAGNERLVINGMYAYSFNTMIPLGLITGQANSFSLRASELLNLDSDTRIVLLDKSSNTEFDLTDGDAYSFNSDATNGDDRFAVLFKSASGLTSIDEQAASGMYVFSQNGRMTIQINSSLSNAKLSVYTVAGQNVYSQSLRAQSTQVNRSFNAGVYLVKVENDGKSLVMRTIIQ